MNDQNEYMDSGILEEFCLGLLSREESINISLAAEKFPAVKQRIEEIEAGLLNVYRINPSPNIKQELFKLIENDISGGTINLENPPLINRFSDLNAWNIALKNLFQPEGDDELKMVPIVENANKELFVGWLYTPLHEDGHEKDEFSESFLILEGTCTCDLNGNLFFLEAGDFITIPPATRHSILPTTPNRGYVKALVQRLKVA